MTVPHIKSAWQQVVAYVDEPRVHRVAYLLLYGLVLSAGFQAIFQPRERSSLSWVLGECSASVLCWCSVLPSVQRSHCVRGGTGSA